MSNNLECCEYLYLIDRNYEKRRAHPSVHPKSKHELFSLRNPTQTAADFSPHPKPPDPTRPRHLAFPASARRRRPQRWYTSIRGTSSSSNPCSSSAPTPSPYVRRDPARFLPDPPSASRSNLFSVAPDALRDEVPALRREARAQSHRQPPGTAPGLPVPASCPFPNS